MKTTPSRFGRARAILGPGVGALLSTLSIASGAGAESRACWVFLEPRAETALSAQQSLEIARQRPPESWAARLAAARPLPDLRDLPVSPEQVLAVGAFGRIRTTSRWLNAVSIELDEVARLRVSRLPFVREVRSVARGRVASLGPEFGSEGLPLERTLSADLLARAVRLGPAPYGPSYGQLEEIGVPAAHLAGYTGNRVRLMMLDTGFRKDHAAFATTRIAGEHDFVFDDGDTQNDGEDTFTQHFHGTGTWAVAGGFDAGHIVGPGYGASFYLAKTEYLPTETHAEEDYYVAALEWAEESGVRVTSASLSYLDFDDGSEYEPAERDGDTAVITRAVDLAAARGILCINANGNYGEGITTLGTPADADSIIAVGAVDSTNLIVAFSARGPTADGRIKPEVVARGLYTWWADASAPDSYGFGNGTSLATPLIGGAAALLAEAHPEWGPMRAREALLESADRHGAPDNSYGHGRIDLFAAIESAPVLYPIPFDLLEPVDGAVEITATPAFRWRATANGGGGAYPQYELRLWEGEDPEDAIVYAAGTDTTFTVPTALAGDTEYQWEVVAESGEGYRRTGRQTWSFRTPEVSDTPGPGTPARRGLEVTPLENPFGAQLRFVARSESMGAASLEWSLFDALGRRIARHGVPAGRQDGFRVDWDPRGTDGRALPDGVYYLEVRLGREATRVTMVRLAGLAKRAKTG